jgi:hypothetical protein
MAKSSKVDLVGVGLNATDTLISCPQFPEPGSKVEFHSANVLPGGQVAMLEQIQPFMDNDSRARRVVMLFSALRTRGLKLFKDSCVYWDRLDPADPAYWRCDWE